MLGYVDYCPFVPLKSNDLQCVLVAGFSAYERVDVDYRYSSVTGGVCSPAVKRVKLRETGFKSYQYFKDFLIGHYPLLIIMIRFCINICFLAFICFTIQLCILLFHERNNIISQGN